MNNTTFKYLLEQFGDLKIMQFQVPNFDELTLNHKQLAYYLSQAAISGRDIVYDQNYEYNLLIRKVLENIYQNILKDPENKRPDEFDEFEIYLKKIWFSNGIHHHHSTDKFFPKMNRKLWVTFFKFYDGPLYSFPKENHSLSEFIETIIFDARIAPKRVSQNSEEDLIKHSAVNFYKNVSQKEAEEFYQKARIARPDLKISWGLNSQLVKEDNSIKENVYSANGLYAEAINQIIFWLKKASEVAENQQQKNSIELLIAYYKTGDLKFWDDYNIAWVKDLNSNIDFVNGFIEDYGDPMGMKATWESIVNFKDIEASRRTEIISNNAQWFEDHSPIDHQFKKKKVKGVSAKAINVVQLGGDCYPSTPIGINLPNADWIRKEHGSKSVTIENITTAYDKASKESGFLEAFVENKEDRRLSKTYGAYASNIHTDLHECLGHGSGQLAEGTKTDALKNYASPLEEARADLFALYFMMDDKMQELGLLEHKDFAKAEYNSYIRNGLMTQLVRIEPGANIEQAHMRNRQLIAKWAYEKGKTDKVIEFYKVDAKTYVRVNNYEKLRQLFGTLLREIQRIKSEGDYEAGKALVENYGVKVDRQLHKEVLDRFKALNIAPYGGFVNPVLLPIYDGSKIVDVKIQYNNNYTEQMLFYSKNYSFLEIKQ
ncbi:MAG: dihydrofolate reductase [Bacteroidales bacterium]|nr:dihydrofolate reductase [Bacteroidales bacterium]